MGVKENRERTSGKEQIFTDADIVLKCIELARPYIKEGHKLIEPAAGDGAFLRGLKSAKITNEILAYDIEPTTDSQIIQQDFLTVDLSSHTSLFALTNPPFGRANSLSVKFFNRLAEAAGCEYIAFIVPISWRKWSVQDRLDQHFHLILDEELPLECFHTPDGAPLKTGILKTVFQIWERQNTCRKKITVEDRNYFTKALPKDADVAFTGFGYKVGQVRTEGEFDRQKFQTPACCS